MEILVICVAGFVAAGLTLFSGFGLGTILLPVFLFFFPVDIAVAATAIVHFLNNLFKLGLVGKHAIGRIVLKFGLPAIAAAFIGALSLLIATDLEPITRYTLGNRDFIVTPVKLLMAVLIIGFAFVEIHPVASQIRLEERYMFLGGALSGFFGGLSGHQGALRSAFLLRAGMSKEAFIATGVVIACLVDVTRMAVYANHFAVSGLTENSSLIVAATVSAFLGSYVGSRLLTKITMRSIQIVVTVLLLLIGLGLGAGII